MDRDWLSQKDQIAPLLDQLLADAAAKKIETCDAARQPTYVMSLRKHVRPVFFPGARDRPSWNSRTLPARCGAEWGSRFSWSDGFTDRGLDCRAPLPHRDHAKPDHFRDDADRPDRNGAFFTGYLWWGVALAYTIEVLDGVDGKLARTKVETTAAGKREHVIDFVIELSWWIALAYHFHSRRSLRLLAAALARRLRCPG